MVSYDVALVFTCIPISDTFAMVTMVKGQLQDLTGLGYPHLNSAQGPSKQTLHPLQRALTSRNTAVPCARPCLP